MGGSFEDIIGMSAIKDAIREVIESRLRFECLYRSLPIKVPTSRLEFSRHPIVRGFGHGKNAHRTERGQGAADQLH